MTRNHSLGFLYLALFLLLLPQIQGIAIGVNRASINFEEVLRGGYAQAEAVITTDSEIPLYAELILLGGDEREWLNFSSRNFTFSKDNPYRLVVEIAPPQDAQITTYRVNMSILTGELQRSDGGLMGSTTRASLGVPILLSMTGTERLSCEVAGVEVQDTERGQPLEVQLTVVNTGNVRVNPDIEIQVWDKFRSEQITQRIVDFGESVLPTVSKPGAVRYTLDLQQDQYWATIRVPQCGYTGVSTFDVLAEGGVKDDGELIRIDMEPWAEVGDIVPISAVFRNRGVRSVRANLRGTVTHMDTGEIVKVINTQQYLVDPSVTANIETFFNPLDPGQYMVEGKVFYNNKLTVEKSAILNVNGSPSRSKVAFSSSTYIILLLLLLIIIFLILIIRKKRRRK